jgi:geranylgeranylglycerol-phosphate geranylgeranyltransferase
MRSAERPLDTATRTGRAFAILRLVRWHNGAIAALGVLVGAWWATGSTGAARTLAATLAALPLAGFANAVNDIADVDIDRLAHPSRPLPSGRLTIREAWLVAAGCAVAALAASVAAGPALGAATALVLVVMALYSARLKRGGLPGNLAVAILASLPFLYGAWSVGRPHAALALLAIAVPLHLAREIAKDIDDADGDRATRRTVPVVRGEGAARTMCVVAVVAGVAAIAPLAVRSGAFALAVVPAALLCVVAAVRVARGRSGGPLLLKGGMVCAMLALLAVRP